MSGRSRCDGDGIDPAGEECIGLREPPRSAKPLGRIFGSAGVRVVCGMEGQFGDISDSRKMAVTGNHPAAHES